MVASLGQARERLLAEHVDARVDPVRELRRLAEAGDEIAVGEVDDPERGVDLRDDDGRGAAVGAVRVEEAAQVDVEQLVAVQRVDGPLLRAMRSGEAQAAAAAERLRLADGDDLGAEAGERLLEQLLAAGLAAQDHARDAGADEPQHLVLGERAAADLDERLRKPAGGVAEALRLAACEDERLHQRRTRGSGSSVSGRAENGEVGRPMPS